MGRVEAGKGVFIRSGMSSFPFRTLLFVFFIFQVLLFFFFFFFSLLHFLVCLSVILLIYCSVDVFFFCTRRFV